MFPLVALSAVKRLPPNWTPDFNRGAVVESADANASNAEANAAPDLSTAHPIARLAIRAKETPYGLAILIGALALVVLIAPICEEFFYRVVFQGALENVALEADDDSTRRRGMALAILGPALIFALIHVGTPETAEEASDPQTTTRLYNSLLAMGVANLAAFFCIGAWLWKSGAGPRDFGLRAKSFRYFLNPRRARRVVWEWLDGAAIFFWASPIIYGVNFTAARLLPGRICDPIPIFIFALLLGVVYWRRRSFPCVVGCHMALNASSALCLWRAFLA
ncbi:MAG: CPBP family intramembrane metalloprotease [Thermoguttaceae bacterium]|nr:CPBP family intramembrane metalloprotease [Thermoguttaceae bacterium]